MKSERQIKLQKHASANMRKKRSKMIILLVSAILVAIPIVLTLYF